MAKGRIRVRLQSYDHRVLDVTCEQLLDTALRTGAKIAGPIPLPTKRSRITVPRSPFTDKTIDSLMHLELPAGVDIEVKM